MDFATPLIFIAIFALASLSLFLVYKFGMKAKSYEEALAEQRQHTSALIGPSKPKPKEKKTKKAAKKEKVIKEKPLANSPETDATSDADNTEGNETHKENVHPPKIHVEFKEELEDLEIPSKEPSVSKKRIKKVRPILVRKDKSPIRIAPLDSITPANHFEELQPKDEFELLRSNSKEDISKPDAVHPAKEQKAVKKSKQQLQVQQQPEPPVEKTESLVVEKTKQREEKSVENVVVPQPQEVTVNTGKEKKKKKSEFNARQQLTAERDQLINSVRKAELSRTEVQMLIDLLLNKQLEAPAVIDEWSEGKSDPMQKLKKQLAEKEKLLAEEQEALVGVQNKLKEIRAEQAAERLQLQQKVRSYEEALQVKQLDMQSTTSRLQINTQKLQQLQLQLNDEVLKNHKLAEENSGLQIQRQQLEVYSRSVQENESMIIKLRSDNEELIRQNQHLTLELQRISQESVAEKEQQQFIMQTNMQNEIDQYNERTRKLEDSLRDLQRKLEDSVRQESEKNIQASNLNAEKNRLEGLVEQLQGELSSLQTEKTENLKTIAQLNTEVQNLEQDKAVQQNGSSEESKAHEVKVLNLTNELTSVKSELSSVNTKFLEAEKKFKTELEEQKEKNNELRKKNWKVMEAFNAAESKINSGKQKDINLDQITQEIRSKEQLAQKQFIERLFPEIQDLKTVSSDAWQEECGRLIKNYVATLKTVQQKPLPSADKSQEVAKLQAQIQHYKKVIDETEGMLNNLQSHIEIEERNWRTALMKKDAELEAIKDSQSSQTLQTKVVDLETQLAQAQNEKQRLLQEHQLLSAKPHEPSRMGDAPADQAATIEKLSEEVNRLREQLRIEQSKNGDVSNVCLKALNSNNTNSTNGPALIEQCPSSSSSRASSEVASFSTKKSKSKKKKKKGNGN